MTWTKIAINLLAVAALVIEGAAGTATILTTRNPTERIIWATLFTMIALFQCGIVYCLNSVLDAWATRHARRGSSEEDRDDQAPRVFDTTIMPPTLRTGKARRLTDGPGEVEGRYDS